MKKKRYRIIYAYELSIPSTEQTESLDFSLYTGASQDCSNSVEQPKVVSTVTRQLPPEVLTASSASTIIHIQANPKEQKAHHYSDNNLSCLVKRLFSSFVNISN